MRRGISPFLSGDTFRFDCDVIFDELSPKLNPGDIRPYDKVFVKTDYLTVFANLCKYIKVSFILITHNSDKPIPNCIPPETSEYLLSRCIWFGQNNLSPKIQSLPIGFGNAQYPHGNPEKIFDYIPQTPQRLEELFYTERGSLVLMSFNTHTNPQRRLIAAKCSEMGIKNKTLGWEDYIRILQKTTFNICPPGNGLDSHRVWETLYCGSIPVIVGDVTTYDLFEDLPVLIVPDWSKFTLDMLSDSICDFKKKKYRFDKLYYPYWQNLIESRKKILDKN